jgi:hypothetical protein
VLSGPIGTLPMLSFIPPSIFSFSPLAVTIMSVNGFRPEDPVFDVELVHRFPLRVNWRVRWIARMVRKPAAPGVARH